MAISADSSESAFFVHQRLFRYTAIFMMQIIGMYDDKYVAIFPVFVIIKCTRILNYV